MSKNSINEDNKIVNIAEDINPNEENALITMKTVYISRDDKDSMKFLTKGIYRVKGNLKQIIYQDTEMTGFENCVTKINIRGNDSITILRRGDENSSDLIMQCDKKFYSQYQTPMGSICLGVMASQIDCNLNDKGGKLHLKYTIDMNGTFVSENEMSIEVTLL